MDTLYQLIDRLILLGTDNHLIDEMDSTYIRNRLLAYFHEPSYEQLAPLSTSLYETLEGLCKIATEKGLIENTIQAKDIFSSTLMNLFMDKPSVIHKTFYATYKDSPEKATQYFYNLSKNSNYIKADRISKNKHFKVSSPYGPLELTINLSKPEKDPKQIALEKSTPAGKYPACPLCVENEGYEGTIKSPDRANHRMIRLKLAGREWMFQYSPYSYYNEHCIILSKEHVPMKVDKECFKALLDFITQFPHYFIGSNAGLPIVGGSILSHEHYQGGQYHFPLNDAKSLFSFELEGFEDIEAHVMHWPLSTIRLKGADKEKLTLASDKIFSAWKEYSDPSLGILSHSDLEEHNALTPITRRVGKLYEIDLVLRNNRTSKEYPLGIFHPHEDVQHIKKENIGLIEVMGLAVLPGRLLEELEEVKKYILDEPCSVKDYHLSWAKALKASYTQDLDLESFILEALGNKFTRILEDAGVFKLTKEGIDGFKQFICTIGNLQTNY